MNLRKIENDALHLSRGERATLIQKLVLSFDTPSPKELREDWVAEAKLRAKDLDEGMVTAIPGDEVFRKARDLIK